MRIGVAQLRSTDDPWENLLAVDAFVAEAADRGCELVSFPENVFYRGPREGKAQALVELEDHAIGRQTDFGNELAAFAESWPITVSLGSVLERSASDGLPFNSHWVVKPGGEAYAYRKIHLFDFDGVASSYRESREITPGTRPLALEIQPGWIAGLSICFDLRFPELYRHLVLSEKANLLLVPSAFTRETGEAHWHTLLRARAVENLAFVAAPAQWGSHLDSKGRELFCYGHSLVYDPWGQLVAEAGSEGDELLVADLDRVSLEVRRTQLPALSAIKLL